MEIKIDETLTVRACPDAVIVETTTACNDAGETHPFTVYLVIPPEEAIKFANAILHAAANLPEEDFSDVPDDLSAAEGTLKSSDAT